MSPLKSQLNAKDKATRRPILIRHHLSVLFGV